MASSINKAIITGNLTRDAELRATTTGTSVLRFSVAVNERVKNPQTGEWEDRPNYIDCTMFGTRAEGVQPYLAKGTKVAIEGRLHWNQWEKDGQKRSKVDIIVDELVLMQGRGDAPRTTQTTTTASAADAYTDEDIPF
jgi:single-strand DNA-binding protein